MNPLVAVTATTAPASEPPGAPHLFLYTTYLAVLQREGLAAVAVSPAHDAASLEAILDRSSGLVLSGGGDIDPRRYDQEAGPTLEWVSEARDAMELRALELAFARGIPVLAICRGVQVLNVQRGGTLWQDLPTQRGGAVRHAQAHDWAARAHEVDIAPGTLLREIVAADRIEVNSFHHQGIRELGRSLRVAGLAPDGLVEAVEDPDYGWLLGVQWHPERQAADLPGGDPDRRILAAFAAAVHAH